MANHYCTENPGSAHDPEGWSFPLRDRILQSATDSGVFSGGTVDCGSRMLTDAFEQENLPASRLLDVGCDYRSIGLPLAAVTGRLVGVVDADRRTVELAQVNTQHNQVTTVDIHSSNVYETLNEMTYVVIASNPPVRTGKKVTHSILTGALLLLKIGGTLTVIIQRKQGASSAERRMTEVFGNAEIMTKDKGYYILRSVKRAE